jgi:coenzyme F420-reducing hydrogenase beta subunit
MNRPRLANFKTCTGCLACVDSCNKNALSKYIATDGHFYIRCNEENCVLCHKCETICPVINGTEYSSNNIKHSYPYSLYSTDNTIYNRSTSGGAFAAIAYNFIKEGGYVCGAILKNNKVIHIVSNQLSDIQLMQGSKYMQSDTEGIYKTIRNLLKQKIKVLFCGVGCQAAAILSFFKNEKYFNYLYTIDMICGGVPSSHLVTQFIIHEKQYKNIIGFRKKEKYILSCYDNNNKLIYLKNQRTLPLYGFFSDLTKRYSCGNCHFCGVERLSDITIGDYWGNNSQKSPHQSIVIIHSKKGEDLINHTDKISKLPVNWSFLKSNYRCVIGKSYNNYRIQRILLPFFFTQLSYKSLCGLYGCNHENIFWLFLKVYNSFIKKIFKLIIDIKLYKIIKKIENNKSTKKKQL